MTDEQREPSSSASKSLAARAAVAAGMLALFAGLAVASTWPLAAHMRTALPIGTEPVATVPLLNAWTVWWNADRATAGFSDYWDAPIFYPAEDTFAFSEPQPTTLIVAPIVWLSETPVLAYNVYLLAALTLNGWATARLLRRLEFGLVACVTGGAMVELLPFVHWQLGVLQLVPLFGFLWTIHAMLDLAREPRWWPAVRLGLSVAVTYLACAHYGLFVLLLLPPAAPILFGRRLLQWRTWLMVSLAAAVCLVVVGPTLVVQWRVKELHNWKRTHADIKHLSARPSDLLTPPWEPLPPLPARYTEQRDWPWPLFPGPVKLALAAIGVGAGLALRRYRRWTLFCLAVAVAAVLLSLGPHLSVFGGEPYLWLFEHVPGVALVRSVLRFAVVGQLMLALLAALAVQVIAVDLLELWRRRDMAEDAGPQHRSRRARLAAVLTTGLALVVGGWGAVELWPPPQAYYEPPPLADYDGWTSWLRENTPEDAVLCCLPFVKGRQVEDYLGTTVWMFEGCRHGRPLVNGYTGFFPADFIRLKHMLHSAPATKCFDELAAIGVTHIVVKQADRFAEWLKTRPVSRSHLELQMFDQRAGVAIYRLVP